MTQFVYDIQGQALAHNPIGNGWVVRTSDGFSESVIETADTPVGDKQWRIVSDRNTGSPAHSIAIWEDGPTDAGTVEVLTLQKRFGAGTPPFLGNFHRADLGGNLNGYHLGLRPDGGTDIWGLHWNNGARTTMNNVPHGIAETYEVWLWIRTRSDGDTHQAKAWLHGQPEPASWMISMTQGTRASGAVGLGGWADEANYSSCAWFSVGTDGDPAALPALNYDDAVLAKSPVAYWPLRENGNDLAGTNHLTLVGSPTFGGADDTVDGYIFFDGTNHAEVASGPFNLTGPLSYEVWAWVPTSGWGSAGAGAQIVALNDRIGLRRSNNTTNLGLILRDGSGDALANYPSWGSWGVAPPFGEWFHIVMVFDRTAEELRGYLNGSLAVTFSAVDQDAATNVTEPFTIGCQYEAGGDARRFFDGRVSSVAVYDSVLSPEAIEQHYTLTPNGTGDPPEPPVVAWPESAIEARVLEDTFERADSATVGNDWIDNYGTAHSIDGNQLVSDWPLAGNGWWHAQLRRPVAEQIRDVGFEFTVPSDSHLGASDSMIWGLVARQQAEEPTTVQATTGNSYDLMGFHKPSATAVRGERHHSDDGAMTGSTRPNVTVPDGVDLLIRAYVTGDAPKTLGWGIYRADNLAPIGSFSETVSLGPMTAGRPALTIWGSSSATGTITWDGIRLFDLTKRQKLFILGDSIPANDGGDPYVPDNRAYPQMFEAMFEYDRTTYALGGADITRACPNGYVAPAGWDAPNTSANVTHAIAQGAEIIIVAFAGNFSSNTNGSGQEGIDNFMDAARAINDACVASKVPCFFIQTSPRSDANQTRKDTISGAAAALLTEFGPERVAQTYDILATATDTLKSEYDSGDGIHPNEAGHYVYYSETLALLETATFDDSVSGSLDAQETGNDVADIAGSVSISGTLDATEAGSDVVSIAGVVAYIPVVGTLAAQEVGSDVVSITGVLDVGPVVGILAGQEVGQDTVAIAGSVMITGTIAAVEVGQDSVKIIEFTGEIDNPTRLKYFNADKVWQTGMLKRWNGRLWTQVQLKHYQKGEWVGR